jgi:hypothetical protein
MNIGYIKFFQDVLPDRYLLLKSSLLEVVMLSLSIDNLDHVEISFDFNCEYE